MARKTLSLLLLASALLLAPACGSEEQAGPHASEQAAAEKAPTPLSDPQHPAYLVAWAALFLGLFFAFRYFDPPGKPLPKKAKAEKGPKPSVGQLMSMQVGKMKEVAPGTKIGTKLVDRDGDEEWYMSVMSVDKSTVRDEEVVFWQERRRAMIRNFYWIAALVAIFTALLFYSGLIAYEYFFEEEEAPAAVAPSEEGSEAP